MLILTRSQNESTVIDDDIKICWEKIYTRMQKDLMADVWNLMATQNSCGFLPFQPKGIFKTPVDDFTQRTFRTSLPRK